MTDPIAPAARPAIVGVQVRRYKNLRDVWLPWSEGVALFGANAVGKSNLLEACTVLAGSRATDLLTSHRVVVPGPRDLSLVVRPGPEALPWPLDLVLPLTHLLLPEWDELVHRDPSFSKAREDLQWWLDLGAREGGNLVAGLRSAGVSDDVVAHVEEESADPVVRYTLERYTPAGDYEPATRSFRRTLVRWRDGPSTQGGRTLMDDGSRWQDVLELPGSDGPAVSFRWLPRDRSPDEVHDDLREAFQGAAQPVADLVFELGRFPFSVGPAERDWHWWLHTLGESAGAAELRLTASGVTVHADGSDDGTFQLGTTRQVDRDSGGRLAVGGALFEPWSSAERRWADEALGTVAEALRTAGLKARLMADEMSALPDDDIVEVAGRVDADIDLQVRRDEFWSEVTFDRIMREVEQRLLETGRERFSTEPDPMTRFRWATAAMQVLAPQLVVRLIDEPEAHLHASGERAVVEALRSLRRRGENVAIATHSPAFLSLTDWSLFHVARSDGPGSTVVPLAGDAGRVGSELARVLGLSRGELLAGISGLLVVEGEHDRLALERLYGERLRDAGLAVVRMHGTNNLMATVDLDFVDRYLSIPITVLTDYTRVERVERNRPATEEERKLVELRRSARGRSRTMTFKGLSRPDIVSYLSESVLRAEYATFPGWQAVLRAFEQRRSRPPFKKFLLESFDVDLTDSRSIGRVLDLMVSGGHRPVGELDRIVNELLSHDKVEDL